MADAEPLHIPLEDRETAESHGLVVKAVVTLLNAMGKFLAAPVGPEEDQADAEVREWVGTFTENPGFAGNVMLALSSLIWQTADKGEVQKWLDSHSAAVKLALEQFDE